LSKWVEMCFMAVDDYMGKLTLFALFHYLSLDDPESPIHFGLKIVICFVNSHGETNFSCRDGAINGPWASSALRLL
jgi:hypothetical protein